MRADYEIGARPRCTQKDEAVLPVFGEELTGVALVEFAAPYHPAGTRETPSLVAQRGKFNSLSPRGVPDVLVRSHRDGLRAFGRYQVDPGCLASLGLVHALNPEKVPGSSPG